MMKYFTLRFIGCLITVLITGCFQIGPAFPERDGKAYLKKEGYPAQQIEAVVSIQPLSHKLSKELSQANSTDVKFLIAQNPSIPLEIMTSLSNDISDFVRGGVALNPAITKNIIDKLKEDSSHTTRLYLCRNPSVPEDTLMYLYEHKEMDLVWFAMNPQCPESLLQHIKESNDESAKYWLELVQKHNKQGNTE